ncbi:MAG: thiamine biosynthesis protein ThiF [Opitutae bacterium]|nr:thiamine biosynthesis protein ThiF [Opitutae bacterium]|tara:strand:- start:435 stop:1610 length:1176 start_codon:yes stop_codon:yes gene_type:complete
MLSPDELIHYQRHVSLPEIGVDGQEKLKQGSVLVIGSGGLGCPALQYLAAAGAGRIGIVDFDVVEASNLQRQTLFGYEDLDRPKAEAAAERLKQLNPHVEIVPRVERFTVENALSLVEGYDVVLDGSDNFPTRYLVNDACVMAGKPLAFGSIFKFEGQVSVFNFDGGPTYRCLFPDCPNPKDVPNCAEIGVFGVLPGIIGSMQAVEVIKIITGVGEPLSGKLLVFDALTMRSQLISFSPDPANQSIEKLEEIVFECEVPEEEEAATESTDGEDEETESAISLKASVSSVELRGLLDDEASIQLIDVREEWEANICSLEGATLIPLGELRRGYALPPALDPEAPSVVYCKAGVRGEEARGLLGEKFGFTAVSNLEGGILAWAECVDSSMRTY